jgi:hypothetical protein
MSPIAAFHPAMSRERCLDSPGRREPRTWILDAASRVFARSGYRVPRISNIVREAGEPAVEATEQAAGTAVDILPPAASPDRGVSADARSRGEAG